MNDFFFYGEKPAKLNVQQLIDEVKNLVPSVEIEFFKASFWTGWPFNERLKKPDYIKEEWKPEDPSDSWQQPDILVIRNVPEQYTRQQVKNFLLNHIASETDEEKARRINADERIDYLVDNASPEKLLKLKNALLSAQ